MMAVPVLPAVLVAATSSRPSGRVGFCPETVPFLSVVAPL
jgi:hypothetical protein